MLMETAWVILFSQRDHSGRCKTFLTDATSFSSPLVHTPEHGNHYVLLFFFLISLTSQTVCQERISALCVLTCWKGLFLWGRDKRESGLCLPAVSHWPKAGEGRVSLPCAHLQRRCFDVAGVAVGTGTLRTDTLKASARVDARCPAATVVLLAQTLVHIWKDQTAGCDWQAWRDLPGNRAVP